MNEKTKSLTEGSPGKLIFAFSAQMMIGLLFQQLYNMADTAIVGKWLGVDSLAAVGSVGSLNFMIMGFCIGVCSGFAIPVAQSFGAGDHKRLRKFAANSVWLSAIFSLVITTVVCVLCNPILKIMQTPENIFDGAYKYIFIIFLGIPATFLYNLLSGVIRALGDSKTPIYFLLLSSVINVVLDIVSITVFGMGVEGPAIATVISQAISGILCLVYIIKKFKILHIKKDEWKIDKSFVLPLISAGLPMGLQYSITAIGSVVLQSSVNMLSSDHVAAVTAGSKVSLFFCCPFEALGGTMATFAGQNIGAKKVDRIKKGIISALAMGFAYSIVAVVTLVLFGDKTSMLFLNEEAGEIITNAHLFLVANSACYILLTIVNVLRFCIQGMGYSAFSVFSGISEMIARSVMGFVIVPWLGYGAVCFANPLAWVMADLFLIPATIYCLKRKKRKFFNEKQTEDFPIPEEVKT